jgi:hypothetical protein
MYDTDARSDVTVDSLTYDIVTAVSDATGQDPGALPPLYEAIDPDALSDMLGRGSDSAPSPELEVRFEYAGCTITVSALGEVTVTQPLQSLRVVAPLGHVRN